MEIDGGRFKHSRRAICLLMVLILFTLGISVTFGARVALNRNQATAQKLFVQKDFPKAAAAYRELANSPKLLLLSDSAVINNANMNADQAIFAWANELDGQAKLTQALAVLKLVKLPQSVLKAGQKSNQMVLDTAAIEANKGAYLQAISTLNLMVESGSNYNRDQVEGLRAGYQILAAEQTVNQDPFGAVALLDDVIANGPKANAVQAREQLSAILLAAAKQAIDKSDQPQALIWLNRIKAEFISSTQADQAQQLLQTSQSVSGTLVHGNANSPIATPVRLATHLTLMGHSETDSGPYYYGVANQNGDFIISGVPVGGPYTLQLQENGSWITPFDPLITASITPLSPTDLTFVILA